jgi:hypothetical protein
VTPEQFIAKWQAADLTERAAAQSHFNDLCELLGEPKPTDADPKGEWYCFERGATKTTGGEGWADVWKRGCFSWEYKSRGKSLDEAIDQLKRYALALENPPLLIASNLDRFRIVTNWTNAISARHEFALDGLREPANRHRLKSAFSDPEQLRPGLTRRHVTEIAAQKFAGLATDVRIRGHEPDAVAHFVNRLVFCMFGVVLLIWPPLRRMASQESPAAEVDLTVEGNRCTAASTLPAARSRACARSDPARPPRLPERSASPDRDSGRVGTCGG